MFDNLSERLQGTFKKLRGQARITEENITQALRDVRMALIEADVALPVVKEVIETIKNAAIGQEVSLKLSPDQAFIKTVKNELVRIMGEENSALNLATQPPAVILMAGLQGSGKTTSSAKLARKLINEKKKVALVSADVYRPAAIEQLKTLAGQVGATFIPSDASEKPADITARALEFAKRQYFDVLIVDTAGRLHTQDHLMEELKKIKRVIAKLDPAAPHETMLIIDAGNGQNALRQAEQFHKAMQLDSITVTKLDGTAKGGILFAISEKLGIPIRYIGVGEQPEDLRPFNAQEFVQALLYAE